MGVLALAEGDGGDEVGAHGDDGGGDDEALLALWYLSAVGSGRLHSGLRCSGRLRCLRQLVGDGGHDFYEIS